MFGWLSREGKRVRERERWERLRESATFSIWKKKSEQRDHWSGAATVQRLSSLRTDWLKSRIGPLSGRHHIGTLFSASRRLQKRAARARRLPFATLSPGRPSTPSSLSSDRSSPSSTLSFPRVSLFLRSLSFSWISMQSAGCNFSTIRPFTLSPRLSFFLLQFPHLALLIARATRFSPIASIFLMTLPLLGFFFFLPSFFYEYFWKIL